MKATTEVRPGLLDNDAAFTDPFYSRFTLRAAPAPIQLTDAVAKPYRFPTLYGDVTCAIGIFLCDYARAAALLPDPRLTPVRMTAGRSLVVLSCYEYKNVMGVAPYNEVSMMIPVQLDATLRIPILPMLAAGLFPSFGYWVFHMPVTSKENQLRGNRIWGLPKVTEDIDVEEQGDECVTTARAADGTPYFELRVPMTGKPTPFDVSANVYSLLDGRIRTSRTSFKATFNVTKHGKPLWSRGATPQRACLRIGDGPEAETLRRLEIEQHPFQFRFAKHMTAAFDLPV